MPLSLPDGHVTGSQFDEILSAGYRRSGWFFYRTHCPACQACEPLRIEVANFDESRSMRRVRHLGDERLQIQVAAPVLDDERLRVFNAHRAGRKLDRGEPEADASDYSSFLLNAFCEVLELSFWDGDKLVAVSITDVGERSLSAVYCYFDPTYSWLSPGTYSILSQISLAKKDHYKWLYLGMFVADNAHLCYKARFGPHERLRGGKWQPFDPIFIDKSQAMKTTPDSRPISEIEFE
jgi:arginine-tRNA-protein transferase